MGDNTRIVCVCVCVLCVCMCVCVCACVCVCVCVCVAFPTKLTFAFHLSGMESHRDKRGTPLLRVEWVQVPTMHIERNSLGEGEWGGHGKLGWAQAQERGVEEWRGRMEGQRKTKRGMVRLGREKDRVREEREEREESHAEMYNHFHIHIMLNCWYHNVQLYTCVLVKASIAVILLVIY